MKQPESAQCKIMRKKIFRLIVLKLLFMVISGVKVMKWDAAIM